MPVLPYCMIEKGSATAPQVGVSGAAVELLALDRITCFYSQLAELPGDQESVRLQALQFHEVVRHIFSQTAVVPFRFPTMLDDSEELCAYLREHAAEFEKKLHRLGGYVQMELRIRFEGASGQATSGREYLQARSAGARVLEHAAAEARRTAGDLVHGWKQQADAIGVRCYFLVRRADVDAFVRQTSNLSLGKGLNSRVSGPWPATEFLDEQP
jgi:hypothetical protein